MTPAEAYKEAVRRIEKARAEEAEILDLGDLPLDMLAFISDKIRRNDYNGIADDF